MMKVWRVNYVIKTKAEVIGHHIFVEATSHKDAEKKAIVKLEYARRTGKVPDDMGLFRVGEYNNYTITKIKSTKEPLKGQVVLG